MRSELRAEVLKVKANFAAHRVRCARRKKLADIRKRKMGLQTIEIKRLTAALALTPANPCDDCHGGGKVPNIGMSEMVPCPKCAKPCDKEDDNG